MLTIRTPPGHDEERRYAIRTVFGDFLGIDVEIDTMDRRDVWISDGTGRGLAVADGLFAQPESRWLAQPSLPLRPLKWWNVDRARLDPALAGERVPVIYGHDPEEPAFFQSDSGAARLGLDIFGSAFFMLTRYEEVVKQDRDVHDRFPASASLASREGFLDRPIVDEYVEILWACLRRLWPGLTRKPREFRILPSHDVDEPYAWLAGPHRRFARTVAGDLLRRRSPARAWHTVRKWRRAVTGHEADPFDTFDWIMDQSERAGFTSAFYFAGAGGAESDSKYTVSDLAIQTLVRRIADRGHEIGFHPSYASVDRPTLWRAEAESLRAHADGIPLKGGRQHYLRFHVPTTWRLWQEGGFDYDSTLGFPDQIGFRCGTCRDYPVFDLRQRTALPLRERPLIVMDRTLTHPDYMKMPLDSAAKNLVLELKRRCRLFGGDFAVLWHNSNLLTQDSKEFYRSLLTAE